MDEKDQRVRVVEQRLRNAYCGMTKEAEMIRRTRKRYLAHLRKKKVEGSNAVSGDELMSSSFYDAQRSIWSKTLRGYHLLRMFLKGKPYKEVEQSLRKSTINPKTAILQYALYGRMIQKETGESLFYNSCFETGKSQPLFAVREEEIDEWVKE
jgi:hypothetical protein